MFDTAKKIKNFILISVLLLFSIIICYQNYNSGTYLSGWDTLHSEFDFGIAFSRAFSPAYQDHQGLGAVSSQSHIGDLPRIIFLYVLSFIFSENFLRYSYVFLMLIIGPLGVYFFLKDLFTKDFFDDEDDSMLFPSFVGALFYLTNLSVVQHFNIPLEMFLTLFGFLGFIFLGTAKLVREFNKKNLLNLVLVSFLISPASHTATLFYMFILVLGVYLSVNLIFSDEKKIQAKNSIISLFIIIGTNLFWILPNIYFILTRGIEVSNSKIHSLFSDQAYLSNLSFGNLSDLSLLKNYLFIWQVWDGARFVPLLDSWIGNLDAGIVLFGYVLFILAVFGIGLTLVKKEKKLYSFVLIFFLSSIFISSSNSFVGGFVDFLRENIPFLKEALRFPFNKFSTLFSFSISVFLAYFTLVLFSFVKRDSLKITSVVFFVLLSSVYFLPAFRGELINPLMRINFKNDYFEVFNYFKNQQEYGRVADLPIHSVYGWSYYSFGYQGAGFLWFGIDKPLLNREFDRWNVKNEDYFNEMTFAIYNNNPKKIEQVLNKYQIRWLLIDKNIIIPNEKIEILNFDATQKTLAELPNLKLDKKIGENIYIYKYSPQEDFVKTKILENVNYISNEFYRESEDLPYEKLGNYYSNMSNETSFGLKTPTEILNIKNISSDEDYFYIKNVNTLRDIQNQSSVSFKTGLLEIVSNNTYFSIPLPETITVISIDDDVLELNQSKQFQLGIGSQIKLYESNETLLTKDLDQFINVRECGIVSFGSRYSLERQPSRYVLTSSNINSCLALDIKNLFSNQNFDNYLLSLRVSNLNSNSYYCVEDSKGGCLKEKLNPNNKVVLKKSDTSILLFNEPVANLEGISSFFDLSIKKLSENKNFKLNIDPTFFNKTELVSITKDRNFSGNLTKFGFNPRVCQTSDTISSRVGFYESSNLNICDNFNINYDPESYHLVEIKSKNYSGLPLRICLQNSETLRCDLFMALPKNKDFKSDFLILPPFKNPHNLAITNQVIEGSTSSNEISYLSIKRIDYNKLFNLHPEKKSKVFTYFKSFDRGFIAFCGFQKCPFEHVLVNNWANGWVLPNDYNLSGKEILIIFWPNYLSLLGALIFLIIVVLSTKYAILNNKPIVDKK